MIPWKLLKISKRKKGGCSPEWGSGGFPMRHHHLGADGDFIDALVFLHGIWPLRPLSGARLQLRLGSFWPGFFLDEGMDFFPPANLVVWWLLVGLRCWVAFLWLKIACNLERMLPCDATMKAFLMGRPCLWSLLTSGPVMCWPLG